MLLFVVCVPLVAEAPELLAELWEAPVLTPAACSSASKSACSVSSASCRLGAVLPLDEVVLDATLLDGVLVAGLAATAGVVVTGVVTGVTELGDVVAVGLVAALEAADPTVETLVPLLAEDADEGNP
jgi:hypothetical protein